MMNKKWLITGVVVIMVAACYFGLWKASAETAAPPPIKATPEFSEGFCAGWNAAQQTEMARVSNWRALILFGREKEDPGSQINVLINSVAAYVLIQSLTGPNSLNDGRIVDCTPKEAAKDPPKPAMVEEPKKP